MDSIEETRQKLIDFLEESHKTQASTAKELDISAAALSQFISGVYTGSNEEIARKAAQFLEMEKRKRKLPPSPAFSDQLRNTRSILNSLQYVHAACRNAAIIGASGSGKTTALKHYAESMNNVIYVQLDAARNTPRAVLRMIFTAIGKRQHMPTADMQDYITNELSGTNKLLIIDEAQHMTERSFDLIRSINDKAGIGIVYAGTPDIILRMIGRKQMELDQVYSRIGYTLELKNDYQEQDIQLLFSGMQLPAPVIRYLTKTANRKGGLRYMLNVFSLGSVYAINSKQPISVAVLKEASRSVGSGVIVE